MIVYTAVKPVIVILSAAKDLAANWTAFCFRPGPSDYLRMTVFACRAL
jgi:hypothetical protein